MSNRPSVTGREAIKAFGTHGFEVARTNGSHHIMKKEGHAARLSIPDHGKKALGKGLLSSLIQAAGISEDEFFDAL